MKKGISMWAFSDRSPEVCFELAKQYGFDGVELALGSSGPVRYDSTEAEMKALREQLNSYGLEAYSLVCDDCWANSLTSNNPESRKKAEEVVICQLKLASWLGCDTILVLPGIVAGFDPKGEVVPYEVVYERAVAAMKKLAVYAEKYGVVLGVENVWNKFLLSPLEMRRFLDEVDHPMVKAYFDVGNVLINGYPQQWIRILGNRIAKVHFKDFVCETYKFIDLLQGDVDYNEVMKAFKEVGYDDWATAEVFPEGDHTTIDVLEVNGPAMQKIMDIGANL